MNKIPTPGDTKYKDAFSENYISVYYDSVANNVVFSVACEYDGNSKLDVCLSLHDVGSLSVFLSTFDKDSMYPSNKIIYSLSCQKSKRTLEVQYYCKQQGLMLFVYDREDYSFGGVVLPFCVCLNSMPGNLDLFLESQRTIKEAS